MDTPEVDGHEDEGESYDANDNRKGPHVGDDDEAILYAAQLDKLAAAGFTAAGPPAPNALVGTVGPPLAGGGFVEHDGPTIVGE